MDEIIEVEDIWKINQEIQIRRIERVAMELEKSINFVMEVACWSIPDHIILISNFLVLIV